MAVVTVKVTAKDIQKGVRDSATDCPIAIATKRVVRRRSLGMNCCIGLSYFNRRRKTVRITTPQEAIDFANAFDNGDHVEPFAFKIRV